ncbi:MAG: hypothetical protein ABL903_12745 [Methylococcales bacterium]
MLKRFIILISSVVLLNGLFGCMYYAEYEDKRAETEIKQQYKALLEVHAQCLQDTHNDYARCPQPSAPR